MRSLDKLPRIFQTAILIVFIGTLLASCGAQEILSKLPWKVEPVNSVALSTSSGASLPIAPQDQTIEKVKGIASLDELIAFNPGFQNDPKKGEPRFVDLQKKEILLSLLQSKIQTAEYQEAQKKLMEIYQSKELWTPEILTLDTKIQEVMKNLPTTSGSSLEMESLITEKNTRLQELQKGKEFQDYIQRNQSKIDSINEEIKKSWTPEMVALKQEIADLRVEIYHSVPAPTN